MLFSIRTAPKTESGDPLEAFVACHERIRASLAIAERAAAGIAARDPDVASAAARVQHYFVDAFPLHERDEEESLRPRLVATGDPRTVALVDRMSIQHAEMEPLVAEIVAASTAVAQGDLSSAAADRLAASARALGGAMQEHLALEEEILLPRARAELTPADLSAIAAEVKARRAARPA